VFLSFLFRSVDRIHKGSPVCLSVHARRHEPRFLLSILQKGSLSFRSVSVRFENHVVSESTSFSLPLLFTFRFMIHWPVFHFIRPVAAFVIVSSQANQVESSHTDLDCRCEIYHLSAANKHVSTSITCPSHCNDADTRKGLQKICTDPPGTLARSPLSPRSLSSLRGSSLRSLLSSRP
jgi:hypothetical protein